MQLHNWYKGGPTIRICVVGNEPANGIFKCGRPDVNPVTLSFEKQNTGNIYEENTEILVSLQTTGAELRKYLSQISNINPDHLKVKCRNQRNVGPIWIEKDNRTLASYGIEDGSGLIAYESYEGLGTQHGIYEEEKRCPSLQCVDISPKQGAITGDDDEMMRLAIEESLRCVPRPPILEEEEKLDTHSRAYILPIPLDRAGADVEEPEKPKTPSTGF